MTFSSVARRRTSAAQIRQPSARQILDLTRIPASVSSTWVQVSSIRKVQVGRRRRLYVAASRFWERQKSLDQTGGSRVKAGPRGEGLRPQRSRANHVWHFEQPRPVRPVIPQVDLRGPVNTLVKFVSRRTKALGQQGVAAKLHVRKWAEARRALQTLESHKGRLDPTIIKRGNDYATEVLGWKGYAPWLHVYSAVAGEFREGWLPENYYYNVVMPKVNGEYGRLSRLRGCNRILFGGESFPDVGYTANGIFYDGDFQPIAWEWVGQYLAEHSQSVVFKADSSGWGHGIFFLESAAVDPEAVKRLGNGVIQKRVVQNEFFDRFMPSSVATIRFGTVIRNDGRPSVRAGYLRFGRSAHSHVVASDQVRIAVDLADGRLAPEGFLSDWTPVDRHPDTGEAFDGHAIPQIEKCVATVLDLHARSPQARCISWDLVVNSEGDVQVLEWEGGVVSFAEATQGPCFADLGWDRLHLNRGSA